jgi:pyrroline-5-carboxylate reductase
LIDIEVRSRGGRKHSALLSDTMKIAFIGGGNMASAIIGGLIRHGVAPSDLCAVDPNEDARARARQQFGIDTLAAADASLSRCDAIVLAVKPQITRDVAKAIATLLSRGQLIISIIAGIPCERLSRWLDGHSRIVRVMPNTPALIGMGVAGMVATSSVDGAGRDLASQVLRAVGNVVWFDDETKIDAVTAVSGSGPAYVFYFIEALQEAAHQLGMDEARARSLAVLTFTGAAQLVAQSDEPPSVLRERVTSKGGTTAAALEAFDHDQVKAAIVRGVLAANARAQEMGEEFGENPPR